jgi:hypothetical protein
MDIPTATEDSFLQPRLAPEALRVTLTVEGLSLLVKCGHLPPPISKESIIDKSKADSLAKALVCLQAVWCLLQVIGRLASHLPVTLLEINTLGHAICALAIYMCWWSKPLDIKVPHVVSNDWLPRPLCAYMWMCSHISRGCLDTDRQRSYEGSVVYVKPLGETTDEEVSNDERAIADERADNNIATDSEGEVSLRKSQYLPGTRFCLRDRMFEQQSAGVVYMSGWLDYRKVDEIEIFTLCPADVQRWRLANKAIGDYGDKISEGK